MALGSVSVNNLNLGQGPVTAIERYFLFIGPASKNVGKFLALNTQSDLDVQLGIPDADLKRQIAAARANGGPRWACMAAPIGADGRWQDALAAAQQQGVSVEAVVITRPVATAAELQEMHAAAVELSNRYGRRVFVMAAVAGLVEGQDWATYLGQARALIADLAAPRVLCVPQLHGNNLGVLAGRLATDEASIADSPMRVPTGAVLALGETPKDKDGVPLDMATLAELDKARYSVPQTYPDYPGVFWGDGNMLDAPGSDFNVVENLRVADKAARQVRILLIQRVADRRVNNTPASMAATASALMRPLREMSRSTTFAGLVFPGEIQPPLDGDVVLTWKSRTEIEVFIRVRPYNCPKTLTANIALDLSGGDEE
ncbi:TPA: DUF2586 domain-containing protein [Pseudomonas aeruginosa]